MRTRLTLAAAGAGAVLTALIAPAASAATAPVAHDDNYNTPVNMNLVTGAPGVLSNDTDADGDPLAAMLVAGAQHGNVNVSGNGAFTYVPTTNYVGPDQFTYRACEVLAPAVLKARQLEAPGCDTATVFITVKGTTPPTSTTTPPPPTAVRRTCGDYAALGIFDIPRTDPRYRLILDRDRDGVACERVEGPAPSTTSTVIVPPPPPANNTFINPAPKTPDTVIITPPAPGGSFNQTPQVPSGSVDTGDASLVDEDTIFVTVHADLSNTLPVLHL